ncbi:sensor histidine kinase [Bacteroides sp. 519]|uniref:sensor histidine kinase n=1 Tax=Bacteroides sp. 519 TaxID=2302937 RepID=UPI0013D05A28|nr:sensor histidine kinase [Bacteroides sp. 519]NDV58555.1 sensor histidine kinase [Bacteroides sp. 519]
MKTQIRKQERFMEILLHVICWSIIIMFPLMFIDRNYVNFNWEDHVRHFMVPFTFMIVFYINYLILIPQYLFREKSLLYLIYNIILISIIGVFLHYWQSITVPPNIHPEHFKPGPRKPRPGGWTFILRDLVGLIFTAGISAIIRITKKWKEIESARKDAEKNRTEAELKNLRNQLNPHFLLNTLNNIYALTAFDVTKAQQAIQELSKLLRYMLYDNQLNFVPLGKEADFIRNYIELMRIRLTPNVKLETHIDIASNNQILITPLIFISLIENAFKHGISSDEPSYIFISLYEKNGEITCEIRNSNYPKTDNDKSGSGIGLPQVKKRLELLYPGKYTWEKNISDDDKEYFSKLVIKT